MKVAVLQTARSGSKSVVGKNIMLIKGTPCYQHNLEYCKEVIDESLIFISTDDQFIMDNPNGCQVIERSRELSSDTASHKDVIIDGLLKIEAKIGYKLDALFVVLGNNIAAYPEDLEASIEILKKKPTATSVMTVSKFNMFNPYRAFNIKGGSIKNFESFSLDKKDSNDKNSLGDFYFFNGSFWLIKRESLFSKSQQEPFKWLGDNIIPLVQNEGIMEIDAPWQIINQQNL